MLEDSKRPALSYLVWVKWHTHVSGEVAQDQCWSAQSDCFWSQQTISIFLTCALNSLPYWLLQIAIIFPLQLTLLTFIVKETILAKETLPIRITMTNTYNGLSVMKIQAGAFQWREQRRFLRNWGSFEFYVVALKGTPTCQYPYETANLL